MPDAEPIAVVLASRRSAILHALLPRLVNEPALRVALAVPDATAHWADRAAVAWADVVLVDDAMLATPLVRALQWRRPDVHVLQWCDRVHESLLETILDRRCDGFVLTCEPADVIVKALRAVCRGELWVPRTMLADALRKRVAPPADGDIAFDTASSLVGSPGALTRRETEVVERLRQGYTNKEIGRELGIMEDTVKKHLQSVFGKLGVHRRGLVMLHHAPAQFDAR